MMTRWVHLLHIYPFSYLRLLPHSNSFKLNIINMSAANKFRVGTFNNISRVGLSRFRQSAYQIGALDSESDPIQDPVSSSFFFFFFRLVTHPLMTRWWRTVSIFYHSVIPLQKVWLKTSSFVTIITHRFVSLTAWRFWIAFVFFFSFVLFFSLF